MRNGSLPPTTNRQSNAHSCPDLRSSRFPSRLQSRPSRSPGTYMQTPSPVRHGATSSPPYWTMRCWSGLPNCRRGKRARHSSRRSVEPPSPDADTSVRTTSASGRDARVPALPETRKERIMGNDKLNYVLTASPTPRPRQDAGNNSGPGIDLRDLLCQAAGGTADIPIGWSRLRHDAERMLQSATTDVGLRREL